MKFHDEDKAWTNRIEPWSGANGFTLFLSKPAWKDDIAVAFDTGLDNGNFTEFDYGIFLVKRNFIVEKIEMIKEKYADKLTSQGNDNWLCYQEVPFKSNYIFDSKEKILAILPSSRESLMLDIFSLLKNHASIVEKICDEINEDCRKSEG
jgi:hypothetical protein